MEQLTPNTPTSVVPITLNGELTDVAAGTTLAKLVQQVAPQAKYFAVERNEMVVPRALLAETPVAAGDRIEVVTMVGGG